MKFNRKEGNKCNNGYSFGFKCLKLFNVTVFFRAVTVSVV